MNDVAFNAAQEHLSYYDKVMAEHHEVQECWETDDLLQLGIDAFTWIRRAESRWREDVYSGRETYSAEKANAIGRLYAEWLVPCKFAEKRIAVQLERNYDLDNLAEFRDVCDQVESIVEDWQWVKLGATAREQALND